MILVVQTLHFFLDLYVWIIIGSVVLSWLIAFDVLNIRDPRAQKLMNLIGRITDPVFRPLRKYIPPIGGIDITPIIVIFGIFLLKHLLASVLLGF